MLTCLGNKGPLNHIDSFFSLFFLPLLWQDEKKLVRYRDNQVVSTKGERFSLVKQEESEEMKKTYVNIKPARKYRFHWCFKFYTERGWTEPAQKIFKSSRHTPWQETCTMWKGELYCSFFYTDLTTSFYTPQNWKRSGTERKTIAPYSLSSVIDMRRNCFWGQLIDNKSSYLMNLRPLQAL